MGGAALPLHEPQQAGRDLYMDPSQLTDTVRSCNGCHTLDPAQGFYGTGTKQSFENEPQIMKVPHLRNMYTKVGMFGSSPDSLQPGTIILQQGPADALALMRRRHHQR